MRTSTPSAAPGMSIRSITCLPSKYDLSTGSSCAGDADATSDSAAAAALTRILTTTLLLIVLIRLLCQRQQEPRQQRRLRFFGVSATEPVAGARQRDEVGLDVAL